MGGREGGRERGREVQTTATGSDVEGWISQAADSVEEEKDMVSGWLGAAGAGGMLCLLAQQPSSDETLSPQQTKLLR